MTPIMAHMGHVLVDAPLYGGPVVLLAIAFLVLRRLSPAEPDRSQELDHKDSMV